MTWGGAKAPPPFCYSFHPLSVSPLTDHGDSLHCFTSLRKRLCSLSKQPLSRIRGSSPYTGEPGIKACCRFPAYACSGEPGQRLRAPIHLPCVRVPNRFPLGIPSVRRTVGKERNGRQGPPCAVDFRPKGEKTERLLSYGLPLGSVKLRSVFYLQKMRRGGAKAPPIHYFVNPLL